MYATLYGHTDIVKLLLAAGANVNARRQDGVTALTWADNRPEIRKLLQKARTKK